jgi:hypothetical protein
VRRIKCIEGKIVASDDPSKPARRAPCSKCVKRRRQCQYPDGNGWYTAADSEPDSRPPLEEPHIEFEQGSPQVPASNRLSTS